MTTKAPVKRRSTRHVPSKAQRDLVSLHATMGTTQATIADLLGIDDKTLRKHYRTELDHSLAKANATVGGVLFNKAKAGDTTAMIFWLKTRAQWRDTTNIDVTSLGESVSPKCSGDAVLAALARKYDSE